MSMNKIHKITRRNQRRQKRLRSCFFSLIFIIIIIMKSRYTGIGSYTRVRNHLWMYLGWMYFSLAFILYNLDSVHQRAKEKIEPSKLHTRSIRIKERERESERARRSEGTMNVIFWFRFIWLHPPDCRWAPEKCARHNTHTHTRTHLTSHLNVQSVGIVRCIERKIIHLMPSGIVKRE